MSAIRASGASSACAHGPGAGELVALEREAVDRRGGVHQRGAATGDDALLDRGLGRGDGVLDAVLALLELDLGGRADADDADAAGELGQPLLELLAVPVGVGVVDLALGSWPCPLPIASADAAAVDDRGRRPW